MIYFVATIISIALFIGSLIIVIQNLIQFKKESKDPWQEMTYQADQLVLENDLTGNKNRVYKNLQNSSEIIDHYILSEDDKKLFLLCHFKSEIKDDTTIQITCFNVKEQPISIKWVAYNQVLSQLPIITLPEKSKFVTLSIVQKSVFKAPIVMNIDGIRTFRKIVLWLSLSMFFLFIPIGYFSLQQLSGEKFEEMLNSRTLALGLSLMMLTSIIHYFFLRIWFRKHSN